MKILLTGASGLIGSYLLKHQPLNDVEGVYSPVHDIISVYLRNYIPNGVKCDTGDKNALLELLFNTKPDLVIHCAANGDVDSVEKNPAEAIKTDLMSVILIKEYCELTGCKLVTFSSNAVYDGEHAFYGPYDERHPVNIYGKIKSLSDDIIEGAKCNWIIIRPIFVYGWGTRNWAMKIMKAKELSLVNDVLTQPTYAGDLALKVWDLIKKERYGEAFNLAFCEPMSLYEFGLEVKKEFDLDVKIKPARLEDFGITKRPKNTTFKREETILIKDSLKRMKDEN